MARDSVGHTPLHWAAQYGSRATIQTLLDAGANVNAWGWYEETPLHSAAHWGRKPQGLKCLLMRVLTS